MRLDETESMVVEFCQEVPGLTRQWISAPSPCLFRGDRLQIAWHARPHFLIYGLRIELSGGRLVEQFPEPIRTQGLPPQRFDRWALSLDVAEPGVRLELEVQNLALGSRQFVAHLEGRRLEDDHGDEHF